MSKDKKFEINLDVYDEGKAIKAGVNWKGKKKWSWKLGITVGLLKAAGKFGGFNVTIEK
jgi:hypothetical protein